MQPAFIIKNYLPYSHKILLLHQVHGKIFCMFGKNDQAALLTTGSLVWCMVEQTLKLHQFLAIEIESNLSMQHIALMHDIMRICLNRVPNNIAVPEFFDFLLYVYKNMDLLCDKGRQVVLLRLFLMLDLLADDSAMYHAALLDPTDVLSQDGAILSKYVLMCWDNFYQNLD